MKWWLTITLADSPQKVDLLTVDLLNRDKPVTNNHRRQEQNVSAPHMSPTSEHTGSPPG